MNAEEEEEAIRIISQRPTAPKEPPTEQLYHDDQIITAKNHPCHDVHENRYRFCPSFVGKTWGVMKKMENNRKNIDFFTSQDIDASLKTLCACLEKSNNPDVGVPNYDDCISNWIKNQSEALYMPSFFRVNNFQPSPFDLIPLNVHAIIITDSGYATIPTSFAERSALIALKIFAETLPVMPHIQILDWQIASLDKYSHSEINPSYQYDFSGWTNLRILRLTNVKNTSRIRLPPNLVSLHLEFYFDSENEKSQCNLSCKKVFGDTIKIFQSLLDVRLVHVGWLRLPIFTNCLYFNISNSPFIKTVEVPQCKSFTAIYCKNFVRFGFLTLSRNKSLDAIILFSRQTISEKKLFHLPQGSPDGFKHINVFGTPLASLPTKFSPFAYISLLDAGSKLYINDDQTRENLTFYFDPSFQDIPKKGESLREMIDRIYGFNWSKFITKLQRHYRFKKYIKNIHGSLVKSVGTPDICIHEVARLLGAAKTFKCSSLV